MQLLEFKEKLEELNKDFPSPKENEKGPGGIGHTIRHTEENNEFLFYGIFYSILDKVNAELDKLNLNIKNSNIFNRVNLLINYSNNKIKNNIIVNSNKKNDFYKFLNKKNLELYSLKLKNRKLNLIKDKLIIIIETYLDEE